MTAYFINLFRHHMCLICGAPAIWMPCPGLCERPVQFSNLEGGLTCELRHAYRTVQKRIGLDSNARSRKHCPKALHPMFSPLFLFFFYYELIILLKATSAVFEYLSLRKPAKSSGMKPREASLSLFPLLSPGSTLVMIIGSPVFYLAGISKQDNAS